MKIKYISYSQNAKKIANELKTEFGGEIFDKNLMDSREFLEKNWQSADAFVFISATGIAVRLISKFLESKAKDPAIIVIDNSCRFVISLLSGHLGGANELAKRLAKFLNAQAVITTASDALGVEAVDMYAKRNDLYIEDLNSLTKVTAAIVDNKKIAIIGDGPKINYKNVNYLKDLSLLSDEEAAIIVSANLNLEKPDIPYAILRPKIYNLGLGCKRNTDESKFINFLKQTLEKYNISINSIRKIASIDLKSDERAILEIGKCLNLEIEFFTAKELSEVKGDFKKSEFVKKTVGTPAVSTPAALKLGDELIVDKETKDGMTISITKLNFYEEN
ncbi:MAG: cobalt-precorrin 5A hydrolase [Tissierellia bacterium]|nr:cobalt-precorrin 5A hydrolase [Tissierellia bacterium]